MRFAPAATFLLLLPTIANGEDAGGFLGAWDNPDATSHGGMTRLEVTASENGYVLKAWALAGKDDEVPIGAAKLHLLGDSTLCPGCVLQPGTLGEDQTEPLTRPPIKHGFAHFDHGFADVYLTLRLRDGKLLVEDYNLFKDDSGRPDYRQQYLLTRVEAADAKAEPKL